eukprot:1965474-Amphidinium_carterae.1
MFTDSLRGRCSNRADGRHHCGLQTHPDGAAPMISTTHHKSECHIFRLGTPAKAEAVEPCNTLNERHVKY